MIIESIMTKGDDVITTDVAMSVQDAARLLHANTTSVLVVCSGDGRVVGVLSERDLVRGIAKRVEELKGMRVENLMTPNPVTCGPDSDPIDVLDAMEKGGFRHVPVVNDGILAGFLTKGAITQFLLMT